MLEDYWFSPTKRRRLASSVIPVLCLVGIVYVIRAGFLADGYLIYVLHDTTPQPYPAGGVAVHSAFILAESAMLFFLLRPWSYSYSWQRSAAALAFALTCGVGFAFGAMHAPPYFAAHLVWLWLVILGTFLLCVISAVGAIVRAWNTRKSSPALQTHT